MNVPVYAGSGGLAEVHSDVDAVGLVGFRDPGLGSSDEVHHFVSDGFWCSVE